MGNRKHRNQQRSYKYEEQESDYDYCSERSGVSVESAFDDDDNGKVKTVADQVHKKSLLSSSLVEVRNRYTILDEDEKDAAILNSFCKEDTSRDQVVEDDHSDWCVYHCKSTKKHIRTFQKNALPAPVVIQLQKMEIQKWVDSWCQNHDYKSITGRVSNENGFWIVNIEGFFRDKWKAGYGVIIRDRYGVPLVGSSGVYDQGKPISELYHELQGFNKVLELAIKYGLRKLYLHCTLNNAFNVIESSCSSAGIAVCYCQDKYRNLAFNIVCKRCINSVYPLIQEIVHKCCMFDDSPKFYFDCIRKRYNVAAEYLAKLRVKQEEMKPDEFPEELKDILYKDAHNPEIMFFNSTFNGDKRMVCGSRGW